MDLSFLYLFGSDEDFKNAVVDDYGVKYSRDGLRLLKAPKDLENYVIKPGTKVICALAFNDCNDLSSITIPDSVTEISSSAFEETAWYNNHLDGDVYIGKIYYKYKGSMPQGSSVTIKKGTIGIAEGAFDGCSGLTSITIPNSVTSIGYGAFSEC